MGFKILAVSLLLVAPALHGATYYVDFGSGDDSNAGTASGTAWKHSPGDTNATSMAAGTALSAGDTVLFKSDSVYVGTVLLSWSGTSGNPITYDGSTWGSGTRATVTTTNSVSGRSFYDNAVARSNLVFTGLLLKDNGGYADDDPIWATTNAVTSPPGGTGISLTGGGYDVLITNCYFAEIGQWTNAIPMSGTGSVTGTGVSLRDNQRVQILNCDFTRMKTGVGIKPSVMASNIVIRGSSFHNYMNWLIDIAPGGSGGVIADILIDQCSFFDYKEFDSPNWRGYGEKPHQNGIFLRTAAISSTWTNVYITRCKFWSDQISNGGTASIYLSQGSSAHIENCLFFRDYHANAAINVGFKKSGTTWQGVWVLNNTFLGGTRCMRISPDNVNPDYIEIQNNLFYRTTTTTASDAVSLKPSNATNVVMDYNLYWRDLSGFDESSYAFNDGGYRSFTSWRTAYPALDANSVVADPLVAFVVGNPSEWDGRLQTSSEARGAGVDLSSQFTVDYDGNTRSAWDIGALEYQSPVAQAVGMMRLGIIRIQ